MKYMICLDSLLACKKGIASIETMSNCISKSCFVWPETFASLFLKAQETVQHLQLLNGEQLHSPKGAQDS